MIQTDRKALELIAQELARLGRMLLKIQGYDFAVKHSPGKAIPIPVYQECRQDQADD